jgi:type VI secretion system secreted protein VgrG
MADFMTSARAVLKLEGGDKYTNDPTDPGGPTKYGIALNTFLIRLDPTATEDTIRNLTWTKAMDLYKRYFWDSVPLGQVVDQQTATRFFQMYVNMIPHEAVEVLQRALDAVGECVVVDGSFGPRTLAAVNRAAGPMLWRALEDAQIAQYHVIVARCPSMARHLPGWIYRARHPLGTAA